MGINRFSHDVAHIRVLSEPLNDLNDGRCPGSKLQISEFLYTFFLNFYQR